MRVLLTIGILFLSIFSISAQPAEELKKYQDENPGIWAIYLEDKIELHFEIVDGKLFIYEDSYELTFFLQDMAGYLKEEEIPYSSFHSIENIKATTYIPGAKKYKAVKVKEFKEKDELSSSIFHDDVKYTTFSYEGLQKGAKSELSYRTIYKDEHLLSGEYLSSFIPTEHKSYSIIADEAIDIGIAEFNLDQLDYTFTERNEKGRNIYTWELKNSAKLEQESWSPGIAWYAGHVIPYIKSYTIDGKTTNVFRSTADLFNWYNSLVKDLNTEKNDPEIQALVDSITADAVDEIDVVRKIFYWTQDNIKYIAIEYGMGGFVPREADFICENRYGDCKDMASTITQLLSYAGVESYLTWIGTSKLPYKYSDIPTPVVDNHMIATYIDENGKYYFLDATGRYYKFGVPSAFIQGKEALIRRGENEFEVVTVPQVDPSTNIITEKVHLSIEGNSLYGKAISYIDGYQKSQFEYDIENLDHEDKLKFYKSFFSKGSNKFIPKNFTEENQYPIENPLTVSYDFTIDDYVMTNGDEMYINMNLDNVMIGQKIDDDRTVPVQNRFGISFESVNTLDVPEGWSIDYIPEDLKIETEFILYESIYTIENEQLVLYQNTNILFLNMKKEHFEEWNKSVKQINKNQNEIVIIKQKND